jgi:hydrogenase expression/formation protein HypE
VDENVSTACDLLGLDPLYSANEGKVLIAAAPEVCEELVFELRKNKLSKNAAVIGEVVDYMPSKVILRSLLGGRRILDKLSHDILPRIC